MSKPATAKPEVGNDDTERSSSGTNKITNEVLQKETRKPRRQLRRPVSAGKGARGAEAKACAGGQRQTRALLRDLAQDRPPAQALVPQGRGEAGRENGEVTAFCDQNISDDLQRSVLSFSVW